MSKNNTINTRPYWQTYILVFVNDNEKLEFGTTHLTAILTNFTGKIIAQKDVKIDPAHVEATLKVAIQLIHDLIAQSPIEQESVLGIGVAL